MIVKESVRKTLYVISGILCVTLTISLSIATVQGCDEHGERMVDDVKIFSIALMCLNALVLFAKSCHMIYKNIDGHQNVKKELKRVGRLVFALAIVATVSGAITTTLQFILDDYGTFQDPYHIGTAYSITLTILLSTVIFYSWNMPNQRHYGFYFDHISRELFMANAMQIMFVEISEILPDFGFNCTQASTNHVTYSLEESKISSHGSKIDENSLEISHDIMSMVAFESAIEALFLMLFYQREWAHHVPRDATNNQGRNVQRQEGNQAGPSGATDQCVSDQQSGINPAGSSQERTPEAGLIQIANDARRQQDLDQKYPHILTQVNMRVDQAMLGVGFACLAAPLVPFINLWVVPKRQDPKVAMASWICNTVFFSLHALYSCGLICVIKPRKDDYKIVSDTPDEKLLRWATYGNQLSIFVSFSKAVTSPLYPEVWYRFVEIFANTSEIWLLFTLLYNCLALTVKLGEEHSKKWKGKMQKHVMILGVANIIYWLCDLVQWRMILVVPTEADRIQPRLIMNAAGVILFPFCIYFRVHCSTKPQPP